MLTNLHPGVDLDTARARTGFELRVDPGLAPTEPPSTQQLAIIRKFDPNGFWTG